MALVDLDEHLVGGAQERAAVRVEVSLPPGARDVLEQDGGHARDLRAGKVEEVMVNMEEEQIFGNII